MWWIALVVVGGFILIIAIMIWLNQLLTSGIRKRGKEAIGKVSKIKTFQDFPSKQGTGKGNSELYFVKFVTEDGKEYESMLGYDKKTVAQYKVDMNKKLKQGQYVKIIYDSKNPKRALRIE